MKKILVLFLAAIASLAFVTAPVYAQTEAEKMCSDWKEKLEKAGIEEDPNYESLCGDTSNSENDAKERVGNILNTVFLWAGIVAVIVIIIAGVFYVISQGEPTKIARAKNAILFAAIGLAVIMSSFGIVNFILSKV